MSWFQACRIYKEKTGRWVVPKVGSPEHCEIQNIYNELRYPKPQPSAQEAAPIVHKPLAPIRELVNMIPIQPVKPKVPTCEELEAERCRIAAEEAKALLAEQLAQEACERRCRIEEEDCHRERIKITMRMNAPRKQMANVGRKRCKKTGEMVKCVRLQNSQIISFD